MLTRRDALMKCVALGNVVIATYAVEVEETTDPTISANVLRRSRS